MKPEGVDTVEFQSTSRIRLTLFLVYFIFAVLMNSVGTVILQSIASFDISKPMASVLEACKDLSIVMVSFIVASFLPRYGFRRAIMTGLGLVAVACVAVPLLPSFWTVKFLFLATGTAFALVKVSVYSIAGLINQCKAGHGHFINSIEGFFMVGVLCGFWVFSFYIDSANPASLSWTGVYWPLAGLCVLAMGMLMISPLDESAARCEETHPREEFLHMLRLIAMPLVVIFVISAFLYVLIEQGVNSWLPTFNHQMLHLPAAMSVQVSSIFAGSLALGRLTAGYALKKMHWYPLLSLCLVATAVLMLVSLPLSRHIEPIEGMNWLNAPIAAYIFPLIGFFMAPIYPTLNSMMLMALPKNRHSAMTGMIMIFSALGGTCGSLLTGTLFELLDGQTAFYLMLLPLAGVLITLRQFHHQAEKMHLHLSAPVAA